MVWNKGLTKETDERVAKQAMSLKGKKFSEAHRKNMSIVRLGKIPWNIGLTKKTDKRVEQGAINLSKVKKGKYPEQLKKWGGKAWESGKRSHKKQAEMLLKLNKNPEFIKRRNEGLPKRINALKEGYSSGRIKSHIAEISSTPEMRKKILKALFKRPTKIEAKVNDILQKHFPNEWKYVGDGEVIIGTKCPDFININGEKKLLEVFGRVFHDPQKTFKKTIPYHQTEIGTKEFYRNYGYETIVIWDNEINEEKIIQKINGG